MHKCAFQALKCTFMHNSGLPPPKFDLKSNYFISWFLNQNKVGEDLQHTETCVSGPESTLMDLSGFPLPFLDKNNQF